MRAAQKRRRIFGICRTFFFNACDREARRPQDRRPCYVAYCGHGRTYKSKRFPIDTLGVAAAYALALKWRKERAPLNERTCDIARRNRPQNKTLRTK